MNQILLSEEYFGVYFEKLINDFFLNETLLTIVIQILTWIFLSFFLILSSFFLHFEYYLINNNGYYFSVIYFS